jgi:uncharacterized protein with von Willebrand factor type A (vWA) domain
MFNSARGLLEKWKQRPDPQATSTVKQDAYDRDVFNDIRAMAPKVDKLVKDLSKDWDYAEDLMADIFTDLWQGDPRMRDKQDVLENRRANHEVLGHFRDTPEREQLRPLTMHDEYGTAMACVGAGAAIQESLTDLTAEKERAKEAAEAAKEAREKAKEAMDALDGCFPGGFQPGPGGEDPTLTPEQAEALAAAQAADEALTAAEAGQERATQHLTDQLKQPVSQALKDAKDAAEEDEALCRAFGAADGEIKRMDFEERAALMKRLHESRLARFSAEIGRMRISLSGERMRRVTQARDEAYSVELSGDLSRVLTSELVKLVTNPMLKTKFTLDLANRRLLSRKYRGKERLGKGAIIALVDCSGSMDRPLHYDPNQPDGMTCEAWAKGICLSLLDSAMRQKRDMEVILFSSRSQQIRFSFPQGKASISTVLEMTEHFYCGGTNFEQPLDMALQLLISDYNRNGKPKADLVFMTDDGGSVSPEFTHRWLDAKERLQFRTFGMAIGAGVSTDGVLTTISDNVRSITDLMDTTAVADIFRTV